MNKIIIKNLGPIKDIELEIKNINILFGPQVVGKSLIGRVIYFFENYIDDFFCNFLMAKHRSYEELKEFLFQSFYAKFYNFIRDDTFIKYIFDDDIYISIDIKEMECHFDKLKEMLTTLEIYWQKEREDIFNSITPIYRNEAFEYLKEVLHIKHTQSVFIPDTRNLINSLERYNYFAIPFTTRNILSLDWTLEKFVSISNIANYELLLPKGIGKYNLNNYETKIINIILYFLSKKCYLFIEEPETYLFPETQAYIMELLARSANSGNRIFITTHSPYLLACANNLIYAGNLAKGHENDKERLAKISEIIDKKSWIDYDSLSVNFIEKDGTMINILDKEEKLIDDKKVDSASDIIMDKFNRLFDEVESFDLEK